MVTGNLTRPNIANRHPISFLTQHKNILYYA
nr:MAG TPA: hypothetical protein [Crassvirales sp.]